jgi:hypothetical protein
MDATYRFRFLIYLAAVMLFMSLCFVYAEPLPSHNPLLFQVTPQHSGFLSSLPQQPSFDPAALRAASPDVSPAVMHQLQNTFHVRRSPFRRSRRTAPPLFPTQLPMGPWNASSVLHIVEDGPSQAPATR